MDTATADDDKIIECPRCGIKNPIESDICYTCGASLHAIAPPKNRRPWLPVAVFVIFVVSVLYFYYRSSSTGPPPPKPEVFSAETAAASRKQTKLPQRASLDRAVIKSDPEAEPINIPVGVLQIKDIAGKLITEISVPVVGGGWIAVPTRICLGGASWVLRMRPGVQLEIEGGILNDRDPISLWRIRADQNLESPELYRWSADRPLTWRVPGSPDPPEPVEIGSVTALGNFIKVALPDDISGAGVLIQEDRVVGWTFGDPVAGAFLWNGEEGRNLKAEIRVDDYYRLTFANSREEEFVRALALGNDYSNLDRLEAFVQAFRFDPKLSASQTPAYLKPAAVTGQLRLLLAGAVEQGFAVQTANYFDAEVLVQANDVALMSDVVSLTAETYGFEEAVDLTESVIEELEPKNDREKTHLIELHSGLYQNWLHALLADGQIQDAWQVYERGGQKFPDDLNIHLFGVKLALAQNDWATAEELLAAKVYPAALRDQVRGLQAQISELKSRQGKIVIRFAPGTRQIPVTAAVNQETSQNFIVDTGASMVTIPYATAADLGIIITVRNPRRKVFTASGVIYAPEVVLASVSLEGFETQNVKALVMDIPDRPGLGLLGLNYLRRFRMDLNTDEGMLLLAPK